MVPVSLMRVRHAIYRASYPMNLRLEFLLRHLLRSVRHMGYFPAISSNILPWVNVYHALAMNVNPLGPWSAQPSEILGEAGR